MFSFKNFSNASLIREFLTARAAGELGFMNLAQEEMDRRGVSIF